MKKLIVAIMSILLVVLLIDIPESEARTRRFYGRGGAYDRDAAQREYVCPRPSCCQPYRHDHYIKAPGHYYRYQSDRGFYFRPMPSHRRYGMSRRGGRYGRFGRYHRYYSPGQRRYGRRRR